MKVGVDTGGTFTDVVADDGRIAKILSTPDDPARAVGAGVGWLMPAEPGPAGGQPAGVAGALLAGGRSAVAIEAGGEAAEASGAGRPELLAHGTTVATNALLERRGAAVALVTTAGLGDVIEIARQDRPSLYDQLADRPEPLVPRPWRYEVGGRLAADGTELEPVAGAGDPAAVPAIDPGAEAVAVCLLHADLNPDHERAVAAVLASRGHDVTCSHEISPEMREYERTVTTVINASLRPRTRHYLRRLTDMADEVLVMTSAGGLLPAGDAAELPAALLLSGPAGGVRAGAAVAVANGFPDAITFDMGGTSTDVCLILEGQPAPAAQREVGGFTVRFPSLDVHTIGAGGGSIARIDAGDALVVGPQSAGADPGPACYGRGGTAPTVTDANLAAGRIPDDVAFGGLRLDRAAAERALASAGVTASGVLAVVDANMERALRAVSVERGVDPRGLALVAFGGAGPLHAAALAEALGMAAVVIPARAGVLSALGLLTAPRRRDLVRSWPDPADHTGLADALAVLVTEAAALVAAPPADASGPGGAPPEGAPADEAAVFDAGFAAGAGPGGARPAGAHADRAAADADAGARAGVGGGAEERPEGRAGRAAADADAGPRAGVGGGAEERLEGRAGRAVAGAMTETQSGAAARAGQGTTTSAGPEAAGRLSIGDVVVETAVDCRYRGQSHELTVVSVAAFPAEHMRRNGYAPAGQPVEVIALRATATRAPAVDPDTLPPVAPRIDRARPGPAVLAEPDCTVWIPEGWVAEPGAAGALVLRRTGRGAPEAGRGDADTHADAAADHVPAVAGGVAGAGGAGGEGVR